MPAEKGRENWIDFLRGIGILLVLIGHNNPPFIRYIFGFHMGLFFVLSGYLYKSSNLSLARRAETLFKKYIIPYFLLAFVNLIIHICHIIFVTRSTELINVELLLRYVKGILLVDGENMPTCGPMWFLPALAMALFVFEIIRRSRHVIVRLFLLLLCIVFTVLLQDRMLIFKLHTVFIAVIYLEIGYLIKKYEVTNFLIQNKLTVLSICLCVALGYLCIKFNSVNPWIDISVARFGLFPLNILGAMFITIALMLVSMIIDKYVFFITIPISYIGKHTIFLLSFDAMSNSLAATAADMLNISVADVWYKAFISRSIVLVVMFAGWQLLRLMVPNKSFRKFINY